MTCSSSLNSGSIVKFELLLEFWAQLLCNDVLIAIVRRLESSQWYMANQTDGTARESPQKGRETSENQVCVVSLWLYAR